MPKVRETSNSWALNPAQVQVPWIKTGRIPGIVQGVVQALEKGDLKIALKRSEAILERHPTHAFCKGLHALALELSGLRSDALIHCREVKLAKTVDSQILSYIKIVYERAGMYSEVTTAYESALEEDPQNEENGVSLFLALASELKLQRQQTVAVDLFRRHNGRRYLLWAVGAILAQVPHFGPHRSLDLAEMLLQRAPVDLPRAKSDNATATQLYNEFLVLVAHLTCLRQQGKYSQALRLLEMNEDAVPLTSDVARLRLQLLAEAVMDGIVDTAKDKFLRNVDQWAACREYLVLAFCAEGFLTTQANGHAQREQAAESQDGSDNASEENSPLLAVSAPAYSGDDTTNLLTFAVPTAPVALPGVAKPGDAKAELLDFAGRTDGASARDAGGQQNNLNNHSSVIAGGDASAVAFSDKDSKTDYSFLHEILPSTGHHVHDAYNILMHLQAARDHGSRTPFLGELEMRALAFACNELEALRSAASGEPLDHRSWFAVVSNTDLNDFTDALFSYFAKYGQTGVSCCFDLKPYLCLLDEKHGLALLAKLRQVIHDDQHDLGSDGAVSKDTSEGVDTGQATAGWAARCAKANRYLTFARLNRGLRGLDGLSLESAVHEVSCLFAKWDELQDMILKEEAPDTMGKSHHASAAESRGGDVHGLRIESRPTIEPDELIMLVAVHLLDLDRSYCIQVASSTGLSSGGRGQLPALQDRVYIIDALALLTMRAHANARMRLLLAVLYGSIGAAMPLVKFYESAGLVHAQHESLGHIVLDKLISLGWLEDISEVCKRFQQFHDDFERQTRAELARAYENGGAQGPLHRSYEYRRILDTMQRSVMRGRAIVEQLLVEVAQLGDCGEALYDLLNPRIRQIREIALRPSGAWSTESQERRIFQEFHFLPRCTPLQAVHLGALAAPLVAPPSGGFLRPSSQWAAVFRQGPPIAVVSSAASIWHSVNGVRGPDSASNSRMAGVPSYQSQGSADLGTDVASQLPPLPFTEPSGLEEILAPHRESTAGVMKLRALLLLVIHAVLRPHPTEADLSEMLRELQSTLVAEGLAAHCDPGALSREGGAPRMPNVTAVGLSSGVGGGTNAPGTAAIATTSRQTGEESRSGRNLRRFRTCKSVPADADKDNSEPAAAGSTAAGNISSGKPREGGREQDDGSSIVPESPSVGIEDPKAGLPPPWRPALVTADDLFWRCALMACDIAHRTLQAVSNEHLDGLEEAVDPQIGFGYVSRQASFAPEASRNAEDVLVSELMAPGPGTAAVWEAPRRGLMVLRLLLRDCARAVLEDSPHASEDAVGLGVDTGPRAAALVAAGGTATALAVRPATVGQEADPNLSFRGEPFRMGGHGVQTLSAFMMGPLLILMPIMSFVSSKIMKPTEKPSRCGPLKAAEIARRMKLPPPGGAAADEARRALGDLADELMAILKEIYTALVEAQADDFDHLGGGCLPLVTPRITIPRGRGVGDWDVENARRMVGKSLAGSHRRQLAELERLVRSYMTQLKGLNTKPAK